MLFVPKKIPYSTHCLCGTQLTFLCKENNSVSQERVGLVPASLGGRFLKLGSPLWWTTCSVCHYEEETRTGGRPVLIWRPFVFDVFLFIGSLESESEFLFCVASPWVKVENNPLHKLELCTFLQRLMRGLVVWTGLYKPVIAVVHFRVKGLDCGCSCVLLSVKSCVCFKDTCGCQSWKWHLALNARLLM